MRVRWSEEARTELVRIVREISGHDVEAGRRVGASIRKAVAVLREHPLIGRVVPELELTNIRERIVGSYRVMYLVRHGEIVVLTVVHGRQVAGREEG